MTQASTAVIAIATTADVTMTMGSWKGTAAQLSLPHMSVPFSSGCLGGAAALGRRPGPGREFLSHDLGEQLRRHGRRRSKAARSCSAAPAPT